MFGLGPEMRKIPSTSSAAPKRVCANRLLKKDATTKKKQPANDVARTAIFEKGAHCLNNVATQRHRAFARQELEVFALLHLLATAVLRQQRRYRRQQRQRHPARNSKRTKHAHVERDDKRTVARAALVRSALHKRKQARASHCERRQGANTTATAEAAPMKPEAPR